MTLLSAAVPNLIDIANLLDPKGRVPRIANMLMQQNQMLLDAVFIPANDGLQHRGIITVTLPTTTKRRYNIGTASTKPTFAPVTDVITMFESWATSDYDLVRQSPDPAGVRAAYARPYMESMMQTVTEETIYGSITDDPLGYDGFAVRYDDLTGNIADNVISAGGTGGGSVYTSIWLVCWGEDTICMTYPANSKAGIDHMPFDVSPRQTDTALGGVKIAAYEDRYQWTTGLHVKDWRFAAHGCNIQVSSLRTGSTTNADLINTMITMGERIPEPMMGRCAFYMNRLTREALRKQARTATGNSTLSMETIFGKKILTMDGIPIRTVDQISLQEAEVV